MRDYTRYHRRWSKVFTESWVWILLLKKKTGAHRFMQWQRGVIVNGAENAKFAEGEYPGFQPKPLTE